MATNAKDIFPARATHPGSVLKSELQARGIRQKDFAGLISMPAPNLSELTKGKRHVTEAIAMKLEKALGIPYQTWMNLQNRYHYVVKQHEMTDSSEATASSEEQSLLSRINLKLLYSYFGIKSASAARRLEKLKANLNIDLNSLHMLEVNTAGYFKRRGSLKIDDTNMRTWLLLARSEVSKSEMPTEYSDDKCVLAASRIAAGANDGSITAAGIEKILNDSGIIYKVVNKLDYAPIDAYSMMAGDHPAIVVTYRHNDMDKLVFDVLHEIGHIHKHLAADRSFISMERDSYPESGEEKEADEFASDCLIPPAIWKSILSAGAKSLTPAAVVQTIAKESARHGINPSIAIARYSNDTQSYALRGHRSPRIRE